MPIDNRTPNLDLALPHEDNTFEEDVQRLREALTALDTLVHAKANPSDIVAAIEAVVGAAPPGLNTLAEIAGSLAGDINFAGSMTAALAAKADIDAVILALAEKSDTGHGHAIADVSGLTSALAEKLESIPFATDLVVGGIRVGANLSIDPVTGILSATGGGAGAQAFDEQVITATTDGQTVFTVPGGYIAGAIKLVLNGSELIGGGEDYTATNGSTFTLTTGINNTTDKLVLTSWAEFELASAQNKIQRSAFDDRDDMRAMSPVATDLHILDGVGLFRWSSGGLEIDDDETCFATAGGRWLLIAADPEWVEAHTAPLSSAVARVGGLEAQAAKLLRGSFLMSLTSLAATSSSDFTAVVPGAYPGDVVVATPGNEFGNTTADRGALHYVARVSAPGFVVVSIRNASAAAANITASTWSLLVVKR